MMPRAEQLRLLLFPSSPVDPFDALPIKMPHKSMELFNHFVSYRIFSRTPVPKTQNSACLGMVFGGPGIFRAGILLTALHYSWISPSGSLAHSDMEETYLYHKLEAMRHVNELVADSQTCTTDDCIGLIAALAMAESGMGDTAAAEAHLKGLSTLVNMRRPEEWQHRFWGILQRIILVTGSFIAAAKKPERGCHEQFLSAMDDSNFNTPPPQSSCYPHPTGPVFSTTPFIATRLSPFYMGSTPDLEACKEDAEAEVLMNALGRLSCLTGADGETGSSGKGLDTKLRSVRPRMPHSSEPILHSSYRAGSVDSSVAGTATSSSPSADEADEASNDHVAALLADTDTYIISLLFKPRPICPEAHRTTHVEGWDDQPAFYSHGATSGSNMDVNIDPDLTGRSNINAPDPRTYPYASLPPEQFPSSSRAWASAAYLYLHVILEPLWVAAGSTSTGTDARIHVRKGSSGGQPPKHKAIDNPYLLRLLLDTLKADVQHTEQAMRSGMYSKELWIWMVLVGAYTVAVMDESDVWLDLQGDKARICPEGARFTERMATRLGSRPSSPRCQRQNQTQTSWIGSPAGDSSYTDPFDQIYQTPQDDYASQGSSYFPPSFSSYSSSSGDGESEPEDHHDRQSSHRHRYRSPNNCREEEPNRFQQQPRRIPEKDYIPSLKQFLSSCIRSWSRTNRVTSWEGARQNISKIAWPESMMPAVERTTRQLWEDTMSSTKDQPARGKKGFKAPTSTTTT
ncbi:hypothetical protein QBC37DRAFT_423604 [Rhypophila decipiens]|uniref:Uncharacterized protein n=1 Tax=Rhypophila decipiens TaxID=261697 RepID=A0AAN7B9M3_9PEZI|nr:hypothetical protein QBC37DRAFT_423604 [Rhypophila decipiens]